MEPAPRSSLPGSQRTLAAILFTDVVGFSARMQKAEVKTLEMLRRDFDVMRRVCAEHEGAVLKTTGDGLLMRFTSAVQAVACALAMQQRFADAAPSAPGGDPLQHRIGIHLGDILVQDQDVMGDGVNIASRIQGEAEPGGICISQTVLDVVKNKLELKVVSLGARELKNITEAMPVYRLLLAAQGLGSNAPVAASAGSNPPVAASARRATGMPWMVGGIAAAIVTAFVAGALIRGRTRDQPPTSTAVAEPATSAVVENAIPATAERTGKERFTNQGGGGRKVQAADAVLQLRDDYKVQLVRYDFPAIVSAIRASKGDDATRPVVQLFVRSVEQMQEMKTWAVAAMRQHGRNRPLQVVALAGATPTEASVFLGQDGRLHFLRGTGPAAVDWTGVNPAMLGNIIVALLRETPGTPPRDVILGAQAFARIYNLPALLDAIATMRPAREKDGADK